MRSQQRHHLAQRRRGVLDLRDQPRDGTRITVAGSLDQFGESAGTPVRGSRAGCGRARRPGPRRRTARRRRCRRRGGAVPGRACSTSRAPDMPIGCPTAMAPPLTLTRSSSRPSSRVLAMPDRRERLVDLDQVQVRRLDAVLGARDPDRGCRLALQRRVGTGDDTVSADLGQPRQSRARPPWPCS